MTQNDTELGTWPVGTSQEVASFAKMVKRHFLECELKTADDLIQEYIEYAGAQQEGNEPLQLNQECRDAATRQKLIWLLERLQEEVL